MSNLTVVDTDLTTAVVTLEALVEEKLLTSEVLIDAVIALRAVITAG